MLVLLASLAGPSLGAQTDPAGSIRGIVLDKDFGVPLRAARVALLELQLATTTSEDGTFRFPVVAPGAYTLAVSKDGYERSLISGVIVLARQIAEVRAELASEVVEMEELVVTGDDLLGDSEVGLLEVRAAAINVQDSLSADTIRKAGASDVAGALKLVVGTSVSQGKYATVRGLSDRYTGTTLNGVRVPSADPRRRAVQVDLFPTGTIESVNVSKTFTPDLQGDFTGGGVDILTKSVPEEPVLSASLGVESNSQVTGNEDFLTYRGGGVEPLGFSGSERDLPSAAKDRHPPLPAPNYNPTPEQMAAAEEWDREVRSFAPAMGVDQRTPGHNTSFSILAGNRYALSGGRTLGVLGALTQSHKYDFYEAGQNNGYQVSEPDQPLVLGSPRFDSRGTEEVLVGGLASLVYRYNPQHELGLRTLANQSAEDEARFQVSGGNVLEQNQSLHYTERSVGSGQLYGRHRWSEASWKGVEIDWFAAYNPTRQYEPDVRFFRYFFDTRTGSGGYPSNSTDPDNSRRIFRDISEKGIQWAFNLSLPFSWSRAGEGRIKVGVFADVTDRDYEQRSFYYVFPSQPGNNAASNANREKVGFAAEYPGQLWTDVFTRPDRIGLADNRCPPGETITRPNTLDPPCSARNQLLWVLEPNDEVDVDYRGDQEIRAAYAMGELPVLPRLRLIGGARYESTDLRIDPSNPLGVVDLIELQPVSGDRGVVKKSEEEGRAEIRESSLLPSLALVYDVARNMKLRGSWSRTIARPTFREMAPVAAEEFLAGDEFVGNPDLRMSKITNFDLRWEWFRRPGEVLAASLFYKEIRDPIELISFFAGGRTFVQPVNYETGEVRGAEVEFRLPLEEFLPALKGLVVGANFAVIDSEVDVPELEQISLAGFGLDEPDRRLQGQPDRLFNASITYDNDRIGASAGAFYSVVGDTLLTGAARGSDGGVPNTFETPFRSLDLTYTQRITRDLLSVSLKARNLLEPERTGEYRTPDGDSLVKTRRETAASYGITFHLKW